MKRCDDSLVLSGPPAAYLTTPVLDWFRLDAQIILEDSPFQHGIRFSE